MAIRYATLCTEPVAVVVSEGERILYHVLSKPFASEFGVESRWAARLRDLPAKSVTRRLNAGGKVLSEERGLVSASHWFQKAKGELMEEVREKQPDYEARAGHATLHLGARIPADS